MKMKKGEEDDGGEHEQATRQGEDKHENKDADTNEDKDENEEEIVIDADGDKVTHTSSADEKDASGEDKSAAQDSTDEAEKHDDL